MMIHKLALSGLHYFEMFPGGFRFTQVAGEPKFDTRASSYGQSNIDTFMQKYARCKPNSTANKALGDPWKACYNHACTLASKATEILEKQ